MDMALVITTRIILKPMYNKLKPMARSYFIKSGVRVILTLKTMIVPLANLWILINEVTILKLGQIKLLMLVRGLLLMKTCVVNFEFILISTGVPWMYWEILPNPDPHYSYDYEIGILFS
jgi:hypothetical protein